MFKPLLRTLPSLSGNFTIGCKLNEIQRENSNEYYTYVRTANLMPLQNSLFNKDININLLNGKYEYDVQKYYYVYSNYFYKVNYLYNNKNYKILDLESRYDYISDSRNKDYEFGCKRISNAATDYTFSFYAPIYVDNNEDLPEYFIINFKVDNNIIRTLKIYINKESKQNYLKKYLNLYINKIDNKVIFCLPESLQATYFGIDVKRGGLTQYKDNVIGNIFINQTTINNFDNTICEGFERNTLIMRQIIPLSFMFNLKDLFNDYEYEFFKGYKINVSGYYCTKNDIKYDFYDFDIDYWQSYNLFNKYDSQTGKYKLSKGLNDAGKNINIMDVGYPSLNESKYVKYMFTNKLTPKYCKFKMLYSDDNDPYITNLNFAYSYLENPNQKYGYFPSMLKGIHSNAVIKDKDLKLPIGNNINEYYKISKYFANTISYDSINFDKYKKLMENYCSIWYTPYTLNENNIDINDVIKNDNYWVDVNYDYAYFKGILYNLSKIQKTYNIDKFGVFSALDINYINESDLNSNFVYAKYVLSKNEESDISINSYKMLYDMSLKENVLIEELKEDEETETEYINTEYVYYNKLIDNLNLNKNCFLLHDKIMKENINGKYVEERNFSNETLYYKFSDINDLILTLFKDEILANDLVNELLTYKIIGYLLLNTGSNKNLFTPIETKSGISYQFILKNELFNNPNPESKYEWLYNRLYCVTSSSKNKKLLRTVYDKIDVDDNIYGKTLLLLKDEYIHKYDIINILSKNIDLSYPEYSTLFLNFVTKLSQLDKYYNELYGNINGIEIENYFVKSKNKDNTTIYVDSYNLDNMIDTYNTYESNNINKDDFINKKVTRFIKILDKDHLKEYLYKLNKDEYGNSTFPTLDNIFKYIYVRNRNWLIDELLIDIKDSFISLYDMMISINNEFKILFDNLSNNELINWILKTISDTRSVNDTFTYSYDNNIIELDIYIKKDIYELNNALYTLLSNKTLSISNYLYMYIEDTSNDTRCWNIIDKNYMYANSKNNYFVDINDHLIPLFTNVYINDYDYDVLTSMINNNKIYNYKYVYNNGTYFKEIDELNIVKTYFNSDISKIMHLINLMSSKNINKGWEEFLLKENIEVNDPNIINYFIEYLYDNHTDVFITLKQMLNIKFYSIEDSLNINMKSINDDNLIYDDQYKIYIYTDKVTNKKYGFYFINYKLTNTNNSFYIKNDFNINVQFDSINNHSINDTNKKYFTTIFYLLMPFLKINIFEEFTKEIDTIIYPYEFEISVKYGNSKIKKQDELKYEVLKESETDNLYESLTKLNDEKKIKLLRYFNYITPLLKRTLNISNVWEHKFIESNNIYLNIEKYNIIDKSDINIYKYNKIKLYKGSYNKSTYKMDSYDLVSQIEYKHFNDNVIYNLPKEIEVTEDKKYSYNEITELLENDENLTNIKKDILYKYFKENNLDYKDILLFLFNKYDTSFYINENYISQVKENSKYTITYKFKLI